MSIVARFTIPDSAFALGNVLATDQSAEIRLESLVPTTRETIPYFWVQNGAAERVSEALEASALAADIRTVDRTPDETLFRARWSLDDDPIIEALRRSDGALLAAESDDGTWTLHIRFEAQPDVSTFYQHCVDADITPTLSELHTNSSAAGVENGLTDPQREALEAALESGYFDVPREVTLQELAASLDISDTALSQRLRRGLKTVLSSSRLSPAHPELPDLEDMHDVEDGEHR